MSMGINPDESKCAAWVGPLVRALLTLATLAGAVSPTAAQTISGTVREKDGGFLIPGSFISLLDSSGQVVGADFTTDGGTFSFAVPAPGRYRMRVERIGYDTWVTEPYDFMTRRTLSITVEVEPRPIRLRDLRVEVTAPCFDDPGQGTALATVWEEARKALETAVWAEQRGELRFTLTRWERLLEPGSLRVREATSRTYLRMPLPPFESVPVSQLMRSGFVVMDADSSEYRAPDAHVLLSQEFQNTQCFGLRRATIGGVSKLGVTFRPRKPGSVVQIEGTLWLDEESAELDRVEVSYDNREWPRHVNPSLVGAELVFDRLPDGPFYVRDWWIRFPIYEVGSFVGYRKGGGSVKAISAEGVSFEMGASVAGVVRDSVTGEPLAGADIILHNRKDGTAYVPAPDAADAPFSATTDEEGRFLVGGLPDGTYALGVDHPKLRMAGARLNETQVVVEEGVATESEIWTPSAGTLYARICPRSSRSNRTGAVVGIARGWIASVPVTGVEIEALWQAPRSERPELGDYVSSVSDVSDNQGRFAICGLPVGETIFLRERGASTALQYKQDARVVWQDLHVRAQSVDGRRDFR